MRLTTPSSWPIGAHHPAVLTIADDGTRDKHAANATTEVEVRYRRERLEVTVRNDRPDGPRAGLALAGGGNGLLGLRERVTLLGGTFQAGPTLDGGFEVCASIPAQVPA